MEAETCCGRSYVISNSLHWPSFLRRFRAKHKLSAAELGAELGVDKRTVERWETDPKNDSARKPQPYLTLALLYLATKLQRESEDSHAPEKRE